MELPFEDRVKIAKEKILPILAEYKLDIGCEHYFTENQNATKLLDFVDSRVVWRDIEIPEAPTETPNAEDKGTDVH